MKPKRLSYIIAELQDVLKAHGDLIVLDNDDSSEFSWMLHAVIFDSYFDGKKMIEEKAVGFSSYQEGAKESYDKYVPSIINDLNTIDQLIKDE